MADIINHITSRIDEYGLARERTKRNEFKDKRKIEESKTSINQNIICAKSNEGNLNQKNDDMSDLVDDIFDD